MGRYKKLISNTLLFGIATFSSKILTFLLMPVLTRLLSTAEYSTMDLVVGACNFIVPVISLTVHEAVIRFGLDKTEKKSDVFTTAMLTIFAGYAVLLLCWPVLGLVTRIGDYRVLIYIYVFTSAMRSTVTHFVRASGFVRVFALDGLLTTVSTVALIFVFVAWRQMGVAGYILATIAADAISAFGLILLLRLHRFFKPFSFNRQKMGEMLRYSAPLVPTAVFWWITNLSDRFLVDWISGPDANGLYAAAYKIPTMITLVSTIFIQAWQISAFSEENEAERAKFYTTVFSAYQTLIFLAASGLIFLARPIMYILVDKSFFEAWRYVPFLVLATAFSCLVTFLGTIYNVAKRNRMVTVTTLVGAAVNIALNLLLIPGYGPQGAAFATFFSYFLVFVIRAADTRRYLDIHIRKGRIGVGLALLLLQVYVGIGGFRWWIAAEAAIFLLLALTNLGTVLYILRNLGRQLRRT